MKQLLIIIVVILSLQSCLTVGRIQRNCDKFAQVCITDVEREVIYRDTTIFICDTILVPLPRDTVFLTDTLIVENNVASLVPIHKRFGIIAVDAWVRQSVLNVQAYLTDSTLLYNYNDTIYMPGVVKKETIVKKVEVRHVPAFYKFTFWFFVAIAAAAIFLFIRFMKGILS